MISTDPLSKHETLFEHTTLYRISDKVYWTSVIGMVLPDSNLRVHIFRPEAQAPPCPIEGHTMWLKH